MNTSENPHPSSYYQRRDIGTLKISGADRLDLLHRLTTNDVRDLKPGRSAQTALLTTKGRIIDILTIHCFDDHLLVNCAGGNQSAVQNYLAKYTITEDFHTSDATDKYGIVSLYGDGITEILDSISKILGNHLVSIAKDGTGYIVVLQINSKDSLTNALNDSGFSELTQDEYELFRIKSGIPVFAKELTDDFNPLDAGLERMISFTKGCYLGQEIIARLHSYHKVQHRLAVMELEGDCEPHLPAVIYEGEEQSGTITSCTRDTQTGKTYCLGYVGMQTKEDEVMELRENEVTYPVKILS